jgi:hypothetical protein
MRTVHCNACERALRTRCSSSLFMCVLVPRSLFAGKTFISYYVIKNVLSANKTIERSSERGVVVYVAPNKALVNQVSADVYQRYGLVFGTATDDFQDKALTSEVLITVPSVLEKLLLSPHRDAWVRKIRCQSTNDSDYNHTSIVLFVMHCAHMCDSLVSVCVQG